MAQNPPSQQSIDGHDTRERPVEQLSPVVYCPETEGITIIQQYVFTIYEDFSDGETFTQEGDIWDYDLIGAVGLRTGKTGKATVKYHVKWKGFPISAMSWEPESHFLQSDLELIWSKHGRVNATGEVIRFSRVDDEPRPDLSGRIPTSPQLVATNSTQLSYARLNRPQPVERHVPRYSPPQPMEPRVPWPEQLYLSASILGPPRFHF